MRKPGNARLISEAQKLEPATAVPSHRLARPGCHRLPREEQATGESNESDKIIDSSAGAQNQSLLPRFERSTRIIPFRRIKVY